jgi:TPP-dependent pyruvate/acetoin dehydrogenase alpha subunit
MTHLFKKEEALQLYRQLMLVRLSEEKIQDEYFNDEMKTPVPFRLIPKYSALIAIMLSIFP